MNIAHTFYEEGLGLVYDPSVRSGQKKGVGVSWLNIGDQQVVIVQLMYMGLPNCNVVAVSCLAAKSTRIKAMLC